MSVTYTSTFRGKKKLSYNGYLYVFDNANKSSQKTYWRCEHFKRCSARVHVIDDVVVKEISQHGHEPIPGRKEVLSKFHGLKEKAKAQPLKRPREILAQLGELPESQQSQICSLQSQRRIIQRIRQSTLDGTRLPKSQDFDIPQRFLQTLGGKPMLFWDSGRKDPSRIILFDTTTTLNYLTIADHCFTDSTFKSCPEVFFQFWALHGLVGCSTVPLILGLTSNKSQETYRRRIYAIIKEKRPDFQPRSMLLEMEVAHINAISDVSVDVKITICLFHVCQAVYRRVQGLRDFKPLTSMTRKIAEFVLLLPALAMVTIDKVKEYFSVIANNVPEGVEHLEELLSYFEITYVQKRGGRPPRFKLEMWNQYDRVLSQLPRSNNSIESWHCQVNSVLACAHPSMWKCLNFFQKEFQYQEVRLAALARGGIFFQKRKNKVNEVSKFCEKISHGIS